ncbi:hypothetical protein [Flavobacterium frigidimaris]|uniref:hypothetical protein n=1 Tax=Flavobacterium frigidimaris TaxID=262320 RepID=UPI000F50C918|nr:hypothetical protein [Flavobacterium frigidimaris]
MINHPDIDFLVEEHYNRICTKLVKPSQGRFYYSTSVYEKLNKKLTKYNGTIYYDLFYYLFENHDKIIKNKVHDLEKHIYKLKDIISTNNIVFKVINPVDGKLIYNDIYKDIEDSFDYEAYSASEKPYKLMLALGVDVCPYCNRQYVNTFICPDGKTRATLDHFYSKSEYPYLALSFYNLIPSCYSCNSSLKGRIPFTFNKNINPYHSSFENIVSFTINYKKIGDSKKYISEFYNDAAFMNIDFKSLVHKNRNDYKKAERNIKVFKLKELYNLHKDIVLRVIQQDVIYNKAGYAKTIKDKYPKIFNDEEEVLKTLIGYHSNHLEFNKSPFSRLLRDISDELDLKNKLS